MRGDGLMRGTHYNFARCNNALRLTFLAIVAISLCACSVQSPIKDLPPKLTFETYVNPDGSRHGQMPPAETIDNTDGRYRRLDELLRAERGGWHLDYVTYAPTYVFQTPNLSIDCLPDLVVINSRDGSYSKKIPGALKRLGLPIPRSANVQDHHE